MGCARSGGRRRRAAGGSIARGKSWGTWGRGEGSVGRAMPPHNPGGIRWRSVSLAAHTVGDGQGGEGRGWALTHGGGEQGAAPRTRALSVRGPKGFDRREGRRREAQGTEGRGLLRPAGARPEGVLTAPQAAAGGLGARGSAPGAAPPPWGRCRNGEATGGVRARAPRPTGRRRRRGRLPKSRKGSGPLCPRGPGGAALRSRQAADGARASWTRGAGAARRRGRAGRGRGLPALGFLSDAKVGRERARGATAGAAGRASPAGFVNGGGQHWRGACERRGPTLAGGKLYSGAHGGVPWARGARRGARALRLAPRRRAARVGATLFHTPKPRGRGERERERGGLGEPWGGSPGRAPPPLAGRARAGRTHDAHMTQGVAAAAGSTRGASHGRRTVLLAWASHSDKLAHAGRAPGLGGPGTARCAFMAWQCGGGRRPGTGGGPPPAAAAGAWGPRGAAEAPNGARQRKGAGAGAARAAARRARAPGGAPGGGPLPSLAAQSSRARPLPRPRCGRCGAPRGRRGGRWARHSSGKRGRSGGWAETGRAGRAGASSVGGRLRGDAASRSATSGVPGGAGAPSGARARAVAAAAARAGRGGARGQRTARGKGQSARACMALGRAPGAGSQRAGRQRGKARGFRRAARAAAGSAGGARARRLGSPLCTGASLLLLKSMRGGLGGARTRGRRGRGAPPATDLGGLAAWGRTWGTQAPEASLSKRLESNGRGRPAKSWLAAGARGRRGCPGATAVGAAWVAGPGALPRARSAGRRWPGVLGGVRAPVASERTGAARLGIGGSRSGAGQSGGGPRGESGPFARAWCTGRPRAAAGAARAGRTARAVGRGPRGRAAGYLAGWGAGVRRACRRRGRGVGYRRRARGMAHITAAAGGLETGLRSTAARGVGLRACLPSLGAGEETGGGGGPGGRGNGTHAHTRGNTRQPVSCCWPTAPLGPGAGGTEPLGAT
jgi:hypothetical protein